MCLRTFQNGFMPVAPSRGLKVTPTSVSKKAMERIIATSITPKRGARRMISMTPKPYRFLTLYKRLTHAKIHHGSLVSRQQCVTVAERQSTYRNTASRTRVMVNGCLIL